MHPRRETVVLVACIGPWWSCRLCHKNQYRDDDDPDDDPDDDLDIDPNYNFVAYDAETDDGDASGNSDRGDESDDELDTIGIPEDSAGGGLLDEDNLKLPDEQWSDISQLGTPASNQRLYIISQLLEAVLADNTGTMG